MSLPAGRLPERFPEGTRYVIEARGGADGRLRIDTRYLEYPDGRRVELPPDLAAASSGQNEGGRYRRRSKRRKAHV